MKYTKGQFDALLKSLAKVDRKPFGFLSINEFADRCETSQPAIRQAVVEGRIPKKHLVRYCKSSKSFIAIDWNAAAYDYLIQRTPDKWPADFEPNDEGVYKPFAPQEAPPVDSKNGADDAAIKLLELPIAKLRVELAKAERLELELDLAKGKVIDLEDVIATNREIAIILRSALRSFVSTAAVAVAPLKKVALCRIELQNKLAQALAVIDRLENGTSEKENSDPGSVDTGAEETTDP